MKKRIMFVYGFGMLPVIAWLPKERVGEIEEYHADHHPTKPPDDIVSLHSLNSDNLFYRPFNLTEILRQFPVFPDLRPNPRDGNHDENCPDATGDGGNNCAGRGGVTKHGRIREEIRDDARTKSAEFI